MFKKSLLLLCLCLVVILTGCKTDKEDTTGGSGSSSNPDQSSSEDTSDGDETDYDDWVPEEPVTIRIGTWNLGWYDPGYIDPATGEPSTLMSQSERQAKLEALAKVEEELNVKLEWVLYSDGGNRGKQVILQSVLAGDPVAEIVMITPGGKGVTIPQNVLQDLTDYRHLFGEEADWMLGQMDVFGKTLGFADVPTTGFPYWSLTYNITMLEACDALYEGGYADENGDLIIPAQLWEQGLWDWPTFQDYLTKVKSCTTDTGMRRGSYNRIVHAMEDDYRILMINLFSANGGYLVDANDQLNIQSTQMYQAMEYVQELTDLGVLYTDTYSDSDPTPGWGWNGNNFNRGEAVFTSMPYWFADTTSNALNRLGDELGFVPYPVGPLVQDDPEKYEYHSTHIGVDAMGIPKGVDEKTTNLAIRAIVKFKSETYKAMGYENTQAYIDDEIQKTAARYFPVTHELYGDALKKSYDDWIKNMKTLDRAGVLGLYDPVFYIVAREIWSKKLDPRTALAEMASAFDERWNLIRTTLETEDIIDNQAPIVVKRPDAELILPINTDVASKVNDLFDAYDIGKDTSFGVGNVVFDYSAVDNTKPNKVSVITATATDNVGNTASYNFTIQFFDPNEKVKPELSLIVDEPLSFKIDVDLNKISWSTYIKAVDRMALADGTFVGEETFDLNSRLQANINQVDVTTPGEYTATFTLTDYAGNTSTLSVKIKITVN